MLKHLDLFSGIGGFSLGLEWTGCYQTIAFCEYNKKAQLILKKHWPKIPIYNNIKTLTYEKLKKDKLSKIDIVTGGFPCQDISKAGKGAGITGVKSGLWKEMSRIICEIRPRYVIVENVSALLIKGLSTVLGDLASIGYDAEWNCIPASAIGASHERDRIWIVAYPHNTRKSSQEFKLSSISRNKLRDSSKTISKTLYKRLSKQHEAKHNIKTSFKFKTWSKLIKIYSKIGQKQWAIEPNVGRVAHGLPGRVDRIERLGNAIVPQIAYILGSVIIERENELYKLHRNKEN